MRNLLYLFVFAALLLGLSACSSYYYSMLNSNDPVGEKNERGDFVQENDTVRSSFHWSDRSSSGWSYSEGSFYGDVSLPKGVEFIPPHSKLVNTPLQLANFPFNEIPKEEYVKEQMTTKANTTVNIRVKDFTEEDSPLRFRSYLTLFAGGTNGKPLKHSSFERNFYLAKLIKVGDVAPQYFDEGQQQSGDFFYVKETHGATVGLVVGAIAVTAAGVAIEATLGPVNY